MPDVNLWPPHKPTQGPPFLSPPTHEHGHIYVQALYVNTRTKSEPNRKATKTKSTVSELRDLIHLPNQ